MHPEVADTLWATHRDASLSAENKTAVYQRLADMCRLTLGEGAAPRVFSDTTLV